MSEGQIIRQTALQMRPAAPVCFVISFDPSILVANSCACSGLPIVNMQPVVMPLRIPRDNVNASLEPVVELALPPPSSENLCFDDTAGRHFLMHPLSSCYDGALVQVARTELLCCFNCLFR